MERNILRQVQLVQLEIAKEVKRICENNGIKYFLDSGTLLGAVRHEGFIPWDDDLDLGLLRSEYDKFIQIAEKELDDKYFIQTWDNDLYYPHPYAKIRKKNTLYIENTAQKSKAHNEIFIDIFSYDVLTNNVKKRKKQIFLLKVYKFLMLAKSRFTPWTSCAKFRDKCKLFLVYLPFRVVGIFIKREWIKEKYSMAIQKHNDDISDNVYEASFCGEWVVPARCFASYKRLKFEDAIFSCPEESELYLETVYGDYMTLPPEEERENRHNIIQVKF